MKNEREYPHNLEAEQAVLGAVMMNNEAMNHVATGLVPIHFYEPIHQQIYGAILEYKAMGKVCTPVTLKNIGIEGAYLARLVATATSIVNVHDYSHEIVELSMRRIIFAAAEEVLRDGSRSSADLSGIFAQAIDRVTKATSFKKSKSSRQAGVDFIESLSEPDLFTPTGMARFDKALGGGLRKGQSYGIDGSAGHGKTMMAGTISHNLNYAGKKHLYIAGEMSPEEIHARSLARVVGCTNDAFYDDGLSLAHPRTEGARAALNDPGNVIYQSEAFLTFENLKQYVANAVARHHIEGFILDYLQLVRGFEKNSNFVMHLEDVTQWIAAISKQFNIWSLTLSQATEDGKSRWGSGAKMAFSNLFLLNRVDEAGQPSDESPYAWIQTKKSRHSKFKHVGSAKYPALIINENGPFFDEHHTADAMYSSTKF